MAIRKSSNSGIPFGNTANRPANPAVGQPYFNGQENRLELYTQSVGWQNIVAETPSVVSYTGTILETNSTNTIVINGTNFATGAIAYLIGNDGTEYTASTTTLNSVVQVTAVFGAISASKEPYDVKIVNPSNLYGILQDAVSVNDTPSWTTASGSLGSFAGGESLSTTISATDEENNTLTYSISSGTLPSGVTLNSSTGVISGTPSAVASNTTYSFSASVSDGNNSSSRSFSITVAPFESSSNVLAYFDFANGRSWNGTSTLLDLSPRSKNLPKSAGSYSSSFGGILTTSSEQSIRSTGLIGSITQISMGVWVKIDGSTNRGVIYYGDNDYNNHFYIRDGIMGAAYNFDIGKDINGADTWTPSKYNGQNVRNYITGVSDYGNKYWFYVVRVSSTGVVTTSLNGSNFETSVNAGVNMSGHSNGQFGIAGDPYNDNASSHSYGGAWWYNGLVSQSQVNDEWQRYRTRFGW